MPEDNRDYCLMCDTEIPPGPDFCSDECALKARRIVEEQAKEISECKHESIMGSEFCLKCGVAF